MRKNTDSRSIIYSQAAGCTERAAERAQRTLGRVQYLFEHCVHRYAGTQVHVHGRAMFRKPAVYVHLLGAYLLSSRVQLDRQVGYAGGELASQRRGSWRCCW